MHRIRILQILVAVLAVAAIVQIGVSYHFSKPQATHIASWKFSPNSLQEANQLAKRSISGVVTKVQPASPLVVKVEGEPGNIVQIPVEVATIKVEQTLKGAPTAEVMVFRTGSNTAAGSPAGRAAPTGPAPPKPPGGTDKPAQIPMPTADQARTIILEDDPAYTVGQRVTLLLDDGPTVNVGGRPVQTLKPISPEGRFLETPDKKVVPISRKAFAQQLKNMPDLQFQNQLRALPGGLKQIDVPKVAPKLGQ
jgi:hypothetical protein